MVQRFALVDGAILRFSRYHLHSRFTPMRVCDTCRSTYPSDFTTCPKDQTALRETDELSKGMVLRGKYEILGTIGVGGMATVYSAHHLHLKEDLAIKVVSPRLTGDKDFLDRFRTEAVITRKLRHPNAVRLDDFDITEDGRPFIVMEYVRGEALRTILQKNVLLPVPRALDIASQVALALGAAHKLGIVHRDIKPDNVLLVPQADGSDLVKVLDFGIAKVYDGETEAKNYTPTKTGIVLGTPQYLSPEQASGEKGPNVDGRADLYALGVMLYEMITSELPFQSDNPITLLMHHIGTAPIPPHVRRPELNIPAAVSDLVMKALEKDRNNRFQTGEEFAQTLVSVSASSAEHQVAAEKSTTNTFSTAALAAAASGATAGAPAGPTQRQAAVTKNKPVAAQHAMTKVMGSTGVHTAPAKSGNKKRGMTWVALASGVAVLVVVIWAVLPAKKADAPQEKPITFEDKSTPADQPPPETRRSTPSHPAEPSQRNAAATRDRIRAQALTASGYRRLRDRDFSGATQDFQDALKIDPNNTAALKGLQAAQTGSGLQGITGIFHR
jgi:serine/threonine protein kinase